jgi:pimeloyl-ACP methyl ester carboxylesterase
MTAMNTRLMERNMHITVKDVGLHVKLLSHISEETDEKRPTLVFLHEALGSVGQWKSFPYELCKATGCDGVVYDRLGHGRSSPMTKPRTLEFYRVEAELFLVGLLDALNVRRPLLVGHSDGATIALTFASMFPERTVAVISEAAHVIIEEITLQGIREAQAQYASTDLPVKLARYHGDKTDALFTAWADSWLDPGLRDWNMLPALRAITSPVLIVQGSKDVYGSRRQVDLIEEHVSGEAEVLWLEGCAHVPHLQARPQVLAAMGDFIARVR